MQLPFTRDQFLDLFAAFNTALWPGSLALWVASVAVSALLLWSRRDYRRSIAAILAAHWAWSGLAYHAAFFTRINSAAWLFAALFVVQSALFMWAGVVRGRLSFAPWPNTWAPAAWAMIAYSLVYPAINAAQHQSVWRIPAFGVPCPTTIFTAGMLLLAAPGRWWLSAIPVVWSLVGGSAAFLLDVRADYGLVVAGLTLAVFSGRTRERAEQEITNQEKPG